MSGEQEKPAAEVAQEPAGAPQEQPAMPAQPMGGAQIDPMTIMVAQMLQQMQGKFEQMSGAILGRSTYSITSYNQLSNLLLLL